MAFHDLEEGVVTFVVPARALKMILRDHSSQLSRLMEVAACVAVSKGQDDHLIRKDRYSRFDPSGQQDDAELLAVVISNINEAAKQLPKGEEEP